MIRHIVMWKLKDKAEGAPREKNAGKLKLILEGLKTSIEEIKNVEVGIQINPEDDKAFDVVLICDFENDLDFKMYTRNPHYQKAVKFVNSVTSERFFVDYKPDV